MTQPLTNQTFQFSNSIEEAHLNPPLNPAVVSAPQISNSPIRAADIDGAQPSEPRAVISNISVSLGVVSSNEQPTTVTETENENDSTFAERLDSRLNLESTSGSIGNKHTSATRHVPSPPNIRMASFCELLPHTNSFGSSFEYPMFQSDHRGETSEETLMTPILTLFASCGQYKVVPHKTHQSSEQHEDDSHCSSPSLDSSKSLQCELCPARIPLSELGKVSALKPTTHTVEMLDKLSEYHDAHCESRRSVHRLRAHEECKPIEEGTHATSASTKNSLPGNDRILQKDLEEINIICPSGGDIMQTHPQLCRKAVETFSPLPKKRLPTRPAIEYYPHLLPSIPAPALPLLRPHDRPFPPPRDTALNYFFVQTLPDQSGSSPLPISIADARRRMREVHYDRGSIVNQLDIESKDMADCRKRYESFNKSDHLRGKVMPYQLSQLGFFFVGDRNAIGKLRCSFCRRTIHMFTSHDAGCIEKEWDRRLVALFHRHSHLSATCPTALGLTGDDKRFSTDDMTRVIEPLLRIGSIVSSAPDLCRTKAPDSNTLCESLSILLSTFPDGLVELDGTISLKYFELLAESDYEMFSNFDDYSASEITSDSEIADGLAPRNTPIDYLVGPSPKHPEYVIRDVRCKSFNSQTSTTQDQCRAEANVPSSAQITQATTPATATSSHITDCESLASAGFFFTCTSPTFRVTCFSCGMQLEHWERARADALNEHARSSPCCAWLCRTSDRCKVKRLYLNAQRDQLAGANPTHLAQVTPERNIAFIHDVPEVAGALDPSEFSAANYRFPAEEIKEKQLEQRLELPSIRVLFDEFRYSPELVLLALEFRLIEAGDDYDSVQELVEVLWAYEALKLEKNIDSDANFVARAQEAHKSRAREPVSYPESGHPASNYCCVCTSAPSSITLTPCGHFVVCESCLRGLKQCPACRAVIRCSFRTYTC